MVAPLHTPKTSGLDILRRLDPQRSFRARLGFTLAALYLLGSTLTGLIFARMGEQRETDIVGDMLASEVHHTAEKIDWLMVERYRDIELTATNSLFASPAAYSERRAYLERMQETYRYYKWVGLLDANGKVIVSTGGLLEGVDFSREPIYTQGKSEVYLAEGERDEASEDVVSDVVEGTNRLTVVSAPIKSPNGELLGVVGAYVDWQWAEAMVQSLDASLQNSEQIEIFIVDNNDYVLIGPPALVGTKLATDSVSLAGHGIHNYVAERWPDGQNYLTGFANTSSYSDLFDLGWKVLLRQDMATAQAPARAFQDLNTWISITIGIIFALAGWLLAGRTTRPMLQIANAASRIRNGEAALIPLIKGSDEVAMLSNSLHKLVEDTSLQEQKLKALNEELMTELAERKRAENALRESEEKYRAFVSHSSEGIMRLEVDQPIPTDLPADEQIDLIYRHTYLAECNDVLARMYGGSGSEDLIGMRLADLIPSSDPLNMEYLHAFIASNYRLIEAESHEVDFRGNEKYFSNNFVGVVRDGMIVRAWGTQRDITESKKMETTIRDSEIKFRSVAESATDAIISVNSAGEIIYWNKAAQDIFQYKVEDVLGQTLEMIIPKRYRGMHTHRMQIAHDQSNYQLQRSPLEVMGLKRDGTEFPIELSIASWETEAGKFFSGIVRDITERKRVEESRLAVEAAQKASQAKSEFLSRMSHELRTPLNSILGFGQLLQMDDLDDDQRENVAYIMRAGKHLLGLINEVLDIARIEAGRMSLSLEPVEVAQVIGECLDFVHPMADQRSLHVDGGLASGILQGKYVVADQQRLKQVLLNLLANAIKYNTEGGSVVLTYEETAKNDAELLRISITDTGPGISEEKMHKLFSPFERLDAEDMQVEGSGLGLVLTKRLLEAMGGEIGVDSTVGQGSTFWIELPLTKSMNIQHLITDALSSAHLPTGNSTMLYIEDNPANLALIERIVKRTPGITLLSSMHGEGGIEMAQQHLPDLILLDVQLPDMSGYDVLQRLKSRIETASIPVIVISADGTQYQVQKMLAAGAKAYLTKPLKVQEFLEMLQSTLTHSAEV